MDLYITFAPCVHVSMYVCIHLCSYVCVRARILYVGSLFGSLTGGSPAPTMRLMRNRHVSYIYMYCFYSIRAQG